ncbi:hypothetical protein DFS34DRAFT_353267 [Phlyctochytrium arcticum]|nr:hypothetical protein DFS34DRAFT_353267 [Phlyctochytrium arcticum]
MADSAIVKVFFGLQDNLAFADDDMILELLSLLPQSQGGLFPIAAGLYHARWEVRRAVVRLLRRIGWHEVRLVRLSTLMLRFADMLAFLQTGAKFIAHLNAFVLMTYQRVHQDFYKGEMPPGVAPLLTASPDGSGLFTDGMSTSESSLNRDMGASYLRNVEDNMRSTTESRISSNLRSVTGSTNSLEVRAPTVPDKSSNAIRTFLAPFGSYTAKGQGTPSPAQSPPRSSGGATPPSGTTTPPAPLSPVLRRILQQQQQQQNELKAKLTNIEKSTLPEDTMNPEFGQHLINSPKRIPPSKVAKRLSMDVSPEVIISSSNIQIQPQSSVTDSALSTSMSSSAKLASQDNDFSASARMTPTTLSPFDPTLSPSYSVSSVSSMSDSAQQINSPQRATFNQPRSRLAEASTHSDGHTALYPAQNSKTPGSLNGNFDDSRNPSNQDFVPPPFPAHAMPGSLVRPYPTKITPGGSSAPPADQVSPSRLTVHTASPDRDELPTAPLRKESMQKTMLSPSKSPNFDLPNSPSSSTTQRLSPRISTEGFATEDNSYDYLMDLYGMGSDDSASMSSANTSPVRTIPNSRLSK